MPGICSTCGERLVWSFRSARMGGWMGARTMRPHRHSVSGAQSVASASRESAERLRKERLKPRKRVAA